MRKKLAVLLLAVSLLTLLAACGRRENEERQPAAPAVAADIAQTPGSAPELYSISAVTYGSRVLSVTLRADGPCHLTVSMLDEDGMTLRHGVEADIEGSEEEQSFTFELDRDPPETFLLTAVLTDEGGEQLSDVYINREYTAAYRAFFALTPNDESFKDSVVLDFDGDPGNNDVQTVNFGVLAEGVREDAAGQVAVSEDRQTYTFTSSTAPREGEVVYLSGASTPELIKVGSVTKNSDGSYTVSRDPGATLSDYYQMIKLEIGVAPDAGADTVAAPGQGVSAGPALLSAGGGPVPLSDSVRPDASLDEDLTYSLGSSFSIKPFKVSVTGSLKVSIKLYWDIKLLGPDYIYWAIGTETKLKVAGVIEGDASNADLKPNYDKNGGGIGDLNLYQSAIDGDHVLHLLGVGGAIPQVPGMFYQISADVAFTCKLSGSAGLEGTIKWSSSYVHETGCADKKIHSKEVDFGPKLEGKGSVSVGPEVTAKIGFLDNVVSGNLKAGVKLVLEGKLVGTLMGDKIPTTSDSAHACALCVDGDINLNVTATSDLSYKLTKKVSGKVIDAKLGDFKQHLGTFYCSLVRDDGGANGKDPLVGWGECPFRCYRVSFVSTFNGVEQNGAKVELTGYHSGPEPLSEGGTTPFSAMLIPGDYKVDATLSGQNLRMEFTVAEKPQTQTLPFKISHLTVIVQRSDNQKPISGASVVITDDAGGSISDSTDGDGKAEFTPPNGDYAVKVSMSGYKEAETSATLDGSDKTLVVQLKKDDGVGTLAGYVSTTAAWEPLAQVSVTAHSLTDEEFSDITVYTASDGTYSLALPVGSYALTFKKAGFADSETECAILRDETTTCDIRMRDNPGMLNLTVLLPDGSGSKGIDFEILDPVTYQRVSWGMLIDGMTTIGFEGFWNPLSGGEYILRLYPQGWAYYTTRFVIDGDTDLEVSISPITARNDGLCGDDAYWSREGVTMFIFGHGKLDDKEVKRVINEYGITSVVVEEGITDIGLSFSRNTQLVSVKLPGTVKRIYDSAFNSCTSLREVVLPDGILEIQDYVFNGCSSLSGVTLPSTLTYIGFNAFEGCSSLTSIRIPDLVETVSKYAFKDCSGLGKIYIPAETFVGWHAFEGCGYLWAAQGIYYGGNEEKWETKYDHGGLGGYGEGETRREYNFTPHFNASPDLF